MKNLILNGFAFIAFLALMGWSGAVMAQEELDPLRGERTEHVEVSDLDSRPLSKASVSSGREVTRDSVAVKPAAARKPDAKSENSQDDILSFNFLYYIIQRFKLSDIVD